MKFTATSLVVLALLPSSLSFHASKRAYSKPKDVCHTVWEEVVTPRCKTTFEEVSHLSRFLVFNYFHSSVNAIL